MNLASPDNTNLYWEQFLVTLCGASHSSVRHIINIIIIIKINISQLTS